MHTQKASVLKGHALTCVRGSVELFDNLSFSIRLSETLVVEGSNGSGKTSLLRILCGFTQPAAGEVTWDGEEIGRHENYQQQISYIGHQPMVKLDLTVLENLIFAQRLAGTDKSTTEIKEIIRNAGLFKHRNVLTRHLSAGQKRRVALARLQLEARAIWILDEPLTALDKEFVSEFELVLKNHLDKNGMLIITTHRELDLPEQNVKRLQLA